MTVIAALAATTLILFAALAIDVGIAWSSRSQSQVAARAAALAAAAEIGKRTTPPERALELAKNAAGVQAGLHGAVGNPALQLDVENDVELGAWCPADPGFRTAGVDTSDPDQVTAVRVAVHLDGGASGNSLSPAFFSRVSGYEVQSTAVAYLGYEGSAPPEEFELPLAINGCALSSDCCGSPSFCATGGSPPNPCVGEPSLSCLIPSLLNPIACWTAFDPLSAVSSLELENLIQSGGNPDALGVRDLISLQGGIVDVNVLNLLELRLDAEGGSWVVKLPVVQCDEGGGPLVCAGSRPLSGSVCFQIQGVLPLLQLIQGRFLCPDDPLFEQCRDDDVSSPPRDPGGCNYGHRVTRAVLVE